MTERKIERIDLHMHSTISDGTDTPAELLSVVREAEIDLFSLTDHDAIRGCRMIRSLLTKDDPAFLTGVEFSCRDDKGRYHILGYGYDPDAEAIRNEAERTHRMRLEKVRARILFLKENFGFDFRKEDLDELFNRDNPGKPHIGNLMVRYGYAKSKDDAIHNYIDKKRFPTKYVRPEEAIEAIAKSGGVPVLAHPAYGSGDELIFGEEMEERVRRLMDHGLLGLEAYYSGFTKKTESTLIELAERYDLYVTAGSDYHGLNKLITIGDTNLAGVSEACRGLTRFLERMELL